MALQPGHDKLADLSRAALLGLRRQMLSRFANGQRRFRWRRLIDFGRLIGPRRYPDRINFARDIGARGWRRDGLELNHDAFFIEACRRRGGVRLLKAVRFVT